MAIRKFLWKAALVIVPFVIIFTLVELRLNQVPNSYNTKKGLLEKRLDKIQVLSTGLSHAFSAINPRVWHYQGFNLADVNQDLFYDQQLVSLYLDRMSGLKLVIIPLSYMSLEYRLDTSREAWRRFFYSQVYGLPSSRERSFADLLNIKRYSKIALYTPDEVQKLSYDLFRIGDIGNLIDENGFIGIDGSNIQLINDSVGLDRVELHHQSMKPEYVADNIRILEKLIEQLQSRHINVVLITTPVFHTYSDYMHQDTYQQMQANINKIAQKYQLEYHNYLYDRRFVQGEFLDNDHLNLAGSEKFSKIMEADFINKYLVK